MSEAPASEGVLRSINVSDGGVPKHPVESAHVRETGIEGDRQRDLRHHGGPDRAVCLFASELIEALRREGHHIATGSIGENLTLFGLSWCIMQPGVRLQVGEAQIELTSFAAPCRRIAGSFAGGHFQRVSQELHPGWSRVYGRVLRAGLITRGDSVKVMTT